MMRLGSSFRRHAIPLPLLVAAVTFSGCAHSTSPPSPLPAKEAQAMTASTIPPAAPKLSAEQVLTRLLDLIRNSKSIQEFTPQRLQEFTSMGIEYASNGDDRYGFGEQLTRDWSYGFGVDRSLQDGPRFELSFNSAPGTSPDMTGICKLDFDQFTAELEAMGFTRNSDYDSPPQPPPGEPALPHGRLMYDYFGRPGMRVEVYPRGEANEPHEKISHPCVKMVLIT